MKDWSKCVGLLQNPVDHSSLNFDGKTLVDSEGHVVPMTGGIPWLFQNTSSQMANWKNRFDNQDAHLTKEIETIKYFLNGKTLSESTKKRTERLLQMKSENRKALQKIMAPFITEFSENSVLHEAVKTSLPSTQVLMSYYPNIFRDWVWGEEENKNSLNIISQLVGEKELGNVAVLGAGASRLAFDIHAKHKPDISLLVDINPFLFLVAKKLLSGGSCHLQEFPVAPLGLLDVAVGHRMKLPKDQIKPENLFFVFGDALNPPLVRGSLTTVVTPWFVDIVPMDLANQIKLMNSLVKEGGRWVNFGSFTTNHSDPLKRYSRDEFLELLKQSGFEVERVVEEDIPYLQSPYSAQKRVERIFSFSARKVEACQHEKEDYNYLPDWIRNDDVPIPAVPELKNLVMVNFLFAELLSAVGQGETIASLAKELAPKLNLDEMQARDVLRNLLTRVYEENLMARHF